MRVGERVLPLEYEPTASLAYSLAESQLWDFEIAGYLQGEAEFANTNLRLGMLWPHVSGRIPVVLVHGTASGPARWAELANELLADPLIRDRYELWLFFYNSGNPVLYSAGKLRRTLTELVNAFDPEGRDPALRRMVIVGHSQGGILTRLMTTESGDRFWANVSEVPLEDLELNDETRAMLREALYFEPLPFVERVVFIATPHRGSYQAGRRLGQIAAGLVTLPTGLVSGVADLLENNPNKLAIRKFDELPSSVDNMTPGHPFLVSLEETRPAAGVKSHSIVATKGTGPITSRSDGVIRYTSAHLDWADSEKVVISGHSCQANPDTAGCVLLPPESSRRVGYAPVRSVVGPCQRRRSIADHDQELPCHHTRKFAAGSQEGVRETSHIPRRPRRPGPCCFANGTLVRERTTSQDRVRMAHSALHATSDHPA